MKTCRQPRGGKSGKSGEAETGRDVVTPSPQLWHKHGLIKYARPFELARHYFPTMRMQMTKSAALLSSRPRQQKVVNLIPTFVRAARAFGMCEEQRIDFDAACAGRITWARYFAKWGRTVAL